ncbi:MAG: hypothetical protein NTY76_07795 [Candidatus Omnitrophica bacterium]|nr:hypothetical protein [Candidatus Omnitrophota bacterium]
MEYGDTPASPDGTYTTASPDSTYASSDNKEANIEIPPGMELRMMGSIKMIVPKGTQLHKKGSLVVMEGPDEYAARNIYEMNGRLVGLEARQLNIEKELEGLRQAVLKQQKKPAGQ